MEEEKPQNQDKESINQSPVKRKSDLDPAEEGEDERTMKQLKTEQDCMNKEDNGDKEKGKGKMLVDQESEINDAYEVVEVNDDDDDKENEGEEEKEEEEKLEDFEETEIEDLEFSEEILDMIKDDSFLTKMIKNDDELKQEENERKKKKKKKKKDDDEEDPITYF